MRTGGTSPVPIPVPPQHSRHISHLIPTVLGCITPADEEMLQILRGTLPNKAAVKPPVQEVPQVERPTLQA